MITDDYAATALAIARQLGIASDDDGVLAVSTRAEIEFSVAGHRRVHAIAANGDNLRTAIESDFQRHAAYRAGTHVLPGALDNCVFYGGTGKTIRAQRMAVCTTKLNF